jgi:hypothetical protein
MGGFNMKSLKSKKVLGLELRHNSWYISETISNNKWLFQYYSLPKQNKLWDINTILYRLGSLYIWQERKWKLYSELKNENGCFGLANSKDITSIKLVTGVELDSIINNK